VGTGCGGGRRCARSGAGRPARVEPSHPCPANGGAPRSAAQPPADRRRSVRGAAGRHWEGFSEDEIAERWTEQWQRWRSQPQALEMEGRETLADLHARVAGALEELFAELVDGRAAVVFTHDAVAWALGTGPEVYRHVEVANCSITTVGVVAGVRRLLRTNEKSHLDGLGLDP
jgi:hypothetical protein